MRYTNKTNLPQGIFEALVKDTYDGVKDDPNSISVSALMNPPLQRQLYIKHNSEIVEDASDRLWSVFGSAVHAVLNNISGDGRLKECRFSQDVQGMKVNGQPDLFDIGRGILEDYKVTSVWSLVFGQKDKDGKVEWERQLNCYAWLLRKAGYVVNKMQIIAILRDWNKSNAQKDEDYPRSPIQIIQIKDWGFADQERYVMERVSAHKSAQEVPIEQVPICGDEERWFRPGKFAVQQEGKSKAERLLDTKEEAEKFVKGMTEKAQKSVTIVERKGIDTKCANYCSVARFCSYGKQYFNN